MPPLLNVVISPMPPLWAVESVDLATDRVAQWEQLKGKLKGKPFLGSSVICKAEVIIGLEPLRGWQGLHPFCLLRH